MAFAAPRRNGPPFILDVAQSVVESMPPLNSTTAAEGWPAAVTEICPNGSTWRPVETC